MGKVDNTASSISPRRCSSRIRRPTYKLRKNDDTNFSEPQHKINLEKVVHSNVEEPQKRQVSHSKTSTRCSRTVAVVNNEVIGDLQSTETETKVIKDGIQDKNGYKMTKRNSKKRKYHGKIILDKSTDDNELDQKYIDIEEGNGLKNESKDVENLINDGQSIEDDYIQDRNLQGESGSHEYDNDDDKSENKLTSVIPPSTVNAEMKYLTIKTELEHDLSHEDAAENTCNKSDVNVIDDSGFVFEDLVQNGIKTDGSATEVQEIKDDPDAVIYCSVCSKKFYNRHGLNKHMFLHTDKKPFQCEICGLSFALKYYLTTHRLIHTGTRSHKCDICNKQFLRRTNLNSHKKTHIELKNYHCSMCDKYFKTKPGKDNHDRCYHGNRGFICHTCGKTFSYQTYLRKHLSVHAGEKPYKCLQCGKCFSYNQSLQEHIRRHQGEKPEICHLCAKSFNNKRELKQHLKYHENTEGYACSECNVRYDTLQSLNKHMSKTHGKMHACLHCSESFVNKKHLRTHIYKHHKDATNQRKSNIDLAKGKKVECSYCSKSFFNRYVLCKHLVSKHKVSESEVKGMLNIRKKAISKPMGAVGGQANDVSGRVSDVTGHVSEVNGRVIDGDGDFPISLENDKSFQVYYKDDEMAVYVKRVDDYNDTKELADVRQLTEEPESENSSKMGQHFIVIEGDTERTNEFTGTATNIVSENLTVDLNNSVKSGLSSLPTTTESHSIHNEILASEGNTNDENNYVVITDVHGDAEGLDNQVVGEAEMFEIDDNGSERIVLILNEASGENGIILDGSEQFEIIENTSEIAALSQAKELSENDLNNLQNVGNNFEIVTNAASMITGEYSLNELHDEKSKIEINNGNIVKGIHEYSGVNIAENSELENFLPTHLQSNSENSLTITEYKDKDNNRTTTIERDNEASHSSTSFQRDDSNDLTDNSCIEIVPKNNSDEEFLKFEEALKTKIVDFPSNNEYVAYLDKMIKSLQNAKHSSSQ
ncbi:hypothetical protein ACF0H5_022367 [Mactra antiquata]